MSGFEKYLEQGGTDNTLWGIATGWLKNALKLFLGWITGWMIVLLWEDYVEVGELRPPFRSY